MASTIYNYNLTGGRVFPVAFEYLARRFVRISLVGKTRRELTLNVDYRFISKTEIETTVSWTAGEFQTMEVRRVTSATDRLVHFTDGSILRSQDLNISQIQAIHIAEEGRDVADSALLSDGFTWNAMGRPIGNVGYPSDPSDATTVSYVLDQMGRTLRGTQAEILNEIPLDRANKVLAFDSNRQPIVITPSVGSSMGLELDLRNSTDPLKGAGMIGYTEAGAYPVGTLGAALAVIDLKSLGVKADGSDETDLIKRILLNTRNRGLTLRHSGGVIGLTSLVEIIGVNFEMTNNAAIKVSGSIQATFSSGGIRVRSGGRLEGGSVYTSGSMTASFVSGFAGRPVAVYWDGGHLQNVKVYSQIYGAVKYSSGTGDCTVIGGVYSGFAAELTVDMPYDVKVKYINAGVAYVDMVPATYAVVDCRAVYVRATVPILNKLSLEVNGDLCTKNAIWIQGLGSNTDDQIKRLYLHGSIDRAGYYMDSSGVIQLGHGAGTCVEILNAPKAQIDINTTDPQGYNVAIASGSHGTQVSGLHRGNGGDPVIVVVNSDDVSISGELVRGTVGVSVGEEGATANRCRVSAIIRDMSAAPVLFSKGTGIHVGGCTIDGEPTLGSYTGVWSGPGAVRSVLVVHEGANEVTYVGNTVHGWFTHDVIDRSSIPGRLRVSRSGQQPAAPIMDRNDLSLHKFSRKGISGPFIRMIDNDATGHAYVGEFSLPASGAAFGSMALVPEMKNMTDFNTAGSTLADVRMQYAVVVHMKYVPEAVGKRVAFSLQVDGGTARATEVFYGVFGDPNNPIANSIQGVLHKLSPGEWVPLVMPLQNVIHRASDQTALTHFGVFKMDSPSTFDLTITKPVLMYIGVPPKAP